MNSLLAYDEQWLDQYPQSIKADVRFLQSSDFVTNIPGMPGFIFSRRAITNRVLMGVLKSDMATDLNNRSVRTIASAGRQYLSVDTIPLFRNTFPESPDKEGAATSTEEVLAIGLHALPVPDEMCAWQDILDFKAASDHKLWSFRRFLGTLASKQQTEAEIRDDIEWSLNGYAKEMDRFKLKRSVSFMETYVIPTVEALESFKPSTFLKGVVSIKKRKVELLEGESNAKGRECAMSSMRGSGLGRPSNLH